MRFGFSFDALTFQCRFSWLFGWRTIADQFFASSAHVFSSHEKTAEIPLSSSSVLRRFTPKSGEGQRGRSGETLKKGYAFLSGRLQIIRWMRVFGRNHDCGDRC
jgi:hypothetical protein